MMPENIIIGKQTGDSLRSGSNNILIGNGVNVSSADADNEINNIQLSMEDVFEVLTFREQRFLLLHHGDCSQQYEMSFDLHAPEHQV